MRIFLRLLAIVAVLGSASVAQAHFLFVRILPMAEAGRFAEVYFSDQADAGDTRFISKIASTRLWLQAKPGEFTPLEIHQTPDRLRACLPVRGGVAVVGELTYGVIGKKSFLLKHYPKAVAGSLDEVRAFQPKASIPFEIQLRPDDAGGLTFTALRQGKPVPDAKFTAVGSDLKDHAFTADAQGRATWKPSAPGYFAVYTSQTLPAKGDYKGHNYDEIREFTTIAFAWPIESKGADAKAVALFQEALDARASWSDFPGFRADIKASGDGRPWQGRATISAKGQVTIEMEDEVVAPWVKEQLESLAMHRIARKSDKTPVLRFADQDVKNPLGRLLLFDGGHFASSYRVKDRQLVTVNRHMGKLNMTITVIDNDLNAEKKFLPRSYTVQYWDATTGKLDRSELIQNLWTRVGSWDLPTLLSVTTASGAGQGTKTMSLSQHRLLK
ncbi:MAG TPA: DUF3386 family protein [Gemmataceae bacterium]|nr:DUF3386 family protein [Gemmataceae bacterium]